MRKLLDFLTLMRVYFLFQYGKAARFLNFDKGFIFLFQYQNAARFLNFEEGFICIYLSIDLMY